MRAERGFDSHTLQTFVKMDNTNLQTQKLVETTDNNTNKERTQLLYQYGGLNELDFDYYQGECPETNH